MTRLKALQVYFSATKKAATTLARIMRWSHRKTLKQNALDIGMDYQSAVELARKYKLQHR